MQHNRGKLAVSVMVTAACATLVGRDAFEKRAQLGLIEAIQMLDVTAVRQALALGADPNCVTDNATASLAASGQTPLTYSVWTGSSQIVTAIVEAGGNVNGKDQEGRTPLVVAIYNRNPEMCSTLLHLGADPALPGADPFDKKSVMAPMSFVADEVSSISHERLLPSAVKSQQMTDVTAMYHLLRSRGVHPTVELAMALGDKEEARTLITDTEQIRVNATAKPILYADALQHDRIHTSIKDFDSKEPGPLLRVDVGI